MFQSTHPHGVRPISVDIGVGVRMFQSTHPHGVRLRIYLNNIRAVLFQSTHPHGVRLGAVHACQMAFMFQSTHPHGVRHDIKSIRKIRDCFNPRTRTGCDLAFKPDPFATHVSIHAPARGATW